MKRRIRPQFDWFDDALEVARMTATVTGVRQRVHFVGGPRPWRVSPAVLRMVPAPLEVTC